jgi:hypothetical protein
MITGMVTLSVKEFKLSYKPGEKFSVSVLIRNLITSDNMGLIPEEGKGLILKE